MKNSLFFLAIAIPLVSKAQNIQDSTIQLQPLELKLHFAKQSLLSSTSSTHSLTENHILQQQPTTLLTSMNTIAGIRMEERSPGSYRIAMRGSLIRSPFGIRNTKVYIDEFPLTDAGGNTYLNILDPSFIRRIHIVKGPDGSIYGANTGGVVRIEPKGYDDVKDRIELNLSAGSYGLFQQQIGLQKKINNKYQFSLNQSLIRSDGYRDHTALNKKAFQTAHQWDYNATSQLRLYALYSDLYYQTPGGLTRSQYDSNPRQARPAAGPNPSAEEQKAAIYNKTLYGGLSHRKVINENLFHHIAVYGSNTDFKNPFISNFEVRNENNIGFRTFLSWNKIGIKRNIQMQIGAEATFGWNKIDNYDNEKGVKGNLQAKDDLDNQSINLFYRTQIEILKNWNVEASLGLNKNSISYSTYYPKNEQGVINFDLEWMPRLATSYIHENMSWRISYAKGYSTPTLAEVRSSDNIINTNLHAEKGNNYEIGYKLKSKNERFIFDIAAYNFVMKNGIIRQLNDAGVEYYSNVGEMKQKALESTIWFHVPIKKGLFKAINFQNAFTYNHYRFGNYKINDDNHDGKKITAVPDFVISNSLSLFLDHQFQLNIYHNFTSSSPLNDNNTVNSKKFNLVQTKLNWKTNLSKKLEIQLYFGVDNLLNQKYSLGNDINAFGGRFFNAAPARNYYSGVKMLI